MNLPLGGERTVRICIAPGEFSADLNAVTVCEAMARGALHAASELGVRAKLDRCALASLGPGALATLSNAANVRTHTDVVDAPQGGEVEAFWGRVKRRRSKVMTATALAIHTVLIVWLTMMYAAYMLLFGGRGGTVVVEASSAVGVGLVPEDQRNPARCSSSGLGRLIRLAFNAHPRKVIVALGETASLDGGVGMASALGVKFFDERDERIERPTGADLPRIARIDPSGIDPAVKGTRIVVACHTDEPLASSPAFDNLVRRCREAGFDPSPDEPGAGAGGGAAFAMATFFGATLRPGAEPLLELTRFRQRIDDADLVITGAPVFDRQSLRCSPPIAAARVASELSVPIIALASRVGPPFDQPPRRRSPEWATITDDAERFDRVIPIGALDPDPSEALAAIEAATGEAVRAWLLA